MNLRSRLADVGRVAIEFKPEVFNLRVAVSLEDATVELVACSIRNTAYS